LVLPCGVWLMTVLAAAVGDWPATTATLKPAARSSEMATPRVRPSTLGTSFIATGLGPVE
jgi:hypothetical protein